MLAEISERRQQSRLPCSGCPCFTSARRSFHSAPQIEKDLLRTMPTNACFSSMSSVGVPRLRRVLRALAWLYPDIGYCQGTGMVRTHKTNKKMIYLYKTHTLLFLPF